MTSERVKQNSDPLFALLNDNIFLFVKSASF